MSQIDFDIREVDPSEAGQLTQLAHLAKAYWGYPPEFMQAFDKELTIQEEDLGNKRFCFRIGSCKGKICSFYTLDKENEAEDSIELSALFVEPAFIGKGLGSRLFEHAVQLAKELGASNMIIHSDPYAGNFYQKMGARKIGEVASRSVENRMIPLYKYELE